MEPNEHPIGYVVSGGLKENLKVRLTVSPQEVKEGSFVVIRSGQWQFYGLVTDLQLGSTDPRFADEQSEVRLPAPLAALLHGQTLFTNLEVMPSLMLDVGPDPFLQLEAYKRWEAERDPQAPAKPQPVKTVPSHHAMVRLAGAGDVAEIFGDPSKPGMFMVGRTREQDHPVCVDLDQLVQRSAGIFGATGSGKSFLTRIIVAGLIKHDKTSLLLFDMHNEYAYDDIASDTGAGVVGLKTKFGTKIRVAAVGAGSSIRSHTPDFHLEIAESDITPGDIEMLTLELNLRETTPATLEALYHRFGREWYREFREMKVGLKVEDENGKKVPAPGTVEAWAAEAGVNEAAATALHAKLKRLFNKPYIVAKPAADTISFLVNELSSGKHVILSFGDYDSDLDYLFLTNLITRRIRAEWEKRTNDHRSKDAPKPRQLVIGVEEAHKLLNREMASQTAFATIAREMRKYFVTLLIIDQRPSQIYDEVMSQLGTRITGWLGDDDDIHAVLSGLAARDTLRGMLSRLQPKEEVLLLGWGVPMPILVRSRRYDQRFWQDLGLGSAQRSNDQILRELGF